MFVYTERTVIKLFGTLSLVFCLVGCLAVSTAVAQTEKPRVEVAFVLDTTGSMSGLIEGAKKKIWSMANTIVDQNPDADIYVGLVGYRDIGDEYVTKLFPLTTDIQQIYGELLTFRADGGGDTPESVNEALDQTVTKLGWSDSRQVKASRIVFLVGDAPPHMDYKQDRKYPVVVGEAVQKGIIVNAVQCGDMKSTTRVWKDIARLGKGEYMLIPQDGGRVIVIETPYDVIIREIQIRINKTVIPYGSFRQQQQVSEKARMYEAAPAPASADMASYVNKSGKGARAVTGRGDLVADSKSDATLLQNLKPEELPEELRAMSSKEREDYLAAQAREREELTRKMAEQVTLRDSYIKTKSAEMEAAAPVDSFDANVSNALKKQIK
jgi:Uncharacterized protein encoded in toxicity protection region of plasmid R478, contains von Willebrand factor (vWF) domain